MALSWIASISLPRSPGPWLVGDDLSSSLVGGTCCYADRSLYGRIWSEVIFYILREAVPRHGVLQGLGAGFSLNHCAHFDNGFSPLSWVIWCWLLLHPCLASALTDRRAAPIEHPVLMGIAKLLYTYL